MAAGNKRQNAEQPPVAVLGAGPAGLTAAWKLAKAGLPVTVYEKRSSAGGLGGTTRFEGRHGTYHFDYGGHRFITHNRDLLQLVEELVGDELLTALRQSVIRFQGRTYHYPLSLGNLLRTAPTSLLAGAALDLAAMPFSTPPQATSFADWIEGRFGKTLYRTFFEGYTRKLWGIDPRELSADWAAQRISLIDLRDVARRLLPTGGGTPRTYARSYRYPKHGFGVIFERLAEEITRLGGRFCYDTPVTGLKLSEGTIHKLISGDREIPVGTVVSTLSLPDMMLLTGGESSLKFRGLRFFNMPMAVENVSPNTWQYLSDPGLIATRLQEPKRRSPFMAPEGHSSLMLEIPCDPGDALWHLPDDQLFARAKEDLGHLGIDPALATGEYFSAYARQAYPLMSVGYENERARAIAHLNRYGNLIQCGRQGTFRYIFTDTAMEMGLMAAESLIEDRDRRAEIYDHRNERTVIETQSVA